MCYNAMMRNPMNSHTLTDCIEFSVWIVYNFIRQGLVKYSGLYKLLMLYSPVNEIFKLFKLIFYWQSADLCLGQKYIAALRVFFAERAKQANN